MRPLKTLLLSTSFLFLVTRPCVAAPGQLSVKAGTWSFATENVRQTNESSSGVGAYAFELNYSFFSHWMLAFGFNLIMSDIIQGSSGYGFDLGAKYYPFTDTGTMEAGNDQTFLSIRETWRPYAGIYMRQRTFGLAVSTSYLGPGLTLGVDYSLSKKWLLSAEYRYDYLYGQGDALAIQNNILVGIGLEF
jgi:hypothetical protein